MATMTMIEDAAGKISWECSECGAFLKDRKGFETKTARCPKCGADVVDFVVLYEDEDVDAYNESVDDDAILAYELDRCDAQEVVA